MMAKVCTSGAVEKNWLKAKACWTGFSKENFSRKRTWLAGSSWLSRMAG